MKYNGTLCVPYKSVRGTPQCTIKKCNCSYTFFNLGWLESGLYLNLQLKVVENQLKQIQLEFFL